MGPYELSAKNIILILENFLSEQGLKNSLRVLQEESGIYLNSLENETTFKCQLEAGQWCSLLSSTLDSYAWEEGSPQELGLFDIYELLVQELAILKEYNLIQLILKSIKIYERLKERSPDRFFALENLGIPGSTDLTDTSLWGMSIEKRRKIVAERAIPLLRGKPILNLLQLMDHAFRYQMDGGNSSSSSNLLAKSNTKDEFLKVCSTIKLDPEFRPQICTFSPNGQYLVTGTTDGFIEFWDPITGKYPESLLHFQKTEEGSTLAMENGISAFAFSEDGEYLASGSSDGSVAIWQLLAGACVMKLDSLHPKSISALLFCKYLGILFSGSLDGNCIKISGLKSGILMKELNDESAAHASFIHRLLLVENNTQLLSASADGSIKIWDYKSGKCLLKIIPKHTLDPTLPLNLTQPIQPIGIFDLIPLNPLEFVVGWKSSTIPVISLIGQTVKIIEQKILPDSHLISCGSVLLKGNIFVAVTTTGHLYFIEVPSGKVLFIHNLNRMHILGVIAGKRTTGGGLVAVYDAQGLIEIFSL